MITKTLLLLSTVTLGSTVQTLCIKNEVDDVLIKHVENLNDVNDLANNLNSKGIIIYKDVNSNNENEVSSVALDNQLEIDIRAEIYGKYFFKIDDSTIGEGYLIGTNYTTAIDLEKMIDKVKDEINTGKLCEEYISTCSNDIVSMTIGDSWKSVVSQKLTWSLDYDGVHYGDFSEWYSSFKIITSNYRYYLIAHETYVSPNNDNTDDFRTSKIIYNFDPQSDQVELRDYQPKAKNPEMNITYGSDLSSEISSDCSAKVSASVSSSYSTTLQSPKIYDKGNMAKDVVNIEFDYLEPWSENDPWYSYNINQSMQTSVYLIREKKSNTKIVNMLDKRTIQMVRDDFWPWNDKTVNFNYNITYGI